MALHSVVHVMASRCALGVVLALALVGCQDAVEPISIEGIAAVQGAGERSPHEGERARIEGVVTLRIEDGVFVQNLSADADAATAEALFVMPAADQAVLEVGEHILAEGLVVESGDGAMMTTLADARIEVRGTASLPAPVVLTAPPASWEALEGMRVRVDAELTVIANDNLLRFGEADLAFGGRVFAPTEQALPGEPALALRAANAARRIVLDDASNAQNRADIPWLPVVLGGEVTLRVGSTLAGLEAVVDQRSSAYRLLAVTAPARLDFAPRPPVPPVDGALRIVGMNLLNLFNGDGQGGGFPTERGARDYDAYARQLAKHVAVISALDPTIIAVQELENDGYGPESAAQELAAALNTAQPGASWAVVVPAERPGTDAIAVGLLYRADRVAAVGTPALRRGGPFARGSRPPLAQSFRTPGGPVFTVVSLHFKSKGGCDEAEGANRDQGDGQGCFNAQRLASVEALHEWIGTDPTQSGSDHTLLIGDFNAYSMEDPMRLLRERGWIDPLAGEGSYSFVFDGQSGRLDHALLSPSMAKALRGAAKWHVNADEPQAFGYDGPLGREAGPWRSSDHDPLLIAISL